jgi:hypothetical protein
MAWFLAILVIFLFWQAPQTMSDVLDGIGSAFMAIVRGVAAFLEALTD